MGEDIWQYERRINGKRNCNMPFLFLIFNFMKAFLRAYSGHLYNNMIMFLHFPAAFCYVIILLSRQKFIGEAGKANDITADK